MKKKQKTAMYKAMFVPLLRKIYSRNEVEETHELIHGSSGNIDYAPPLPPHKSNRKTDSGTDNFEISISLKHSSN